MQKIALIGDIMLDVYHHTIERHNPEGKDIPCRTVSKTEYMPGGAGNVAANLAKLGSNFTFISIVGNDPESHILRYELGKRKIPHQLILDESRPTIVKERFMLLPEGKEEYRADYEKTHPAAKEAIDQIKKAVNGADIILISDYNKGLVTKDLIDELKKTNIKIIVDTKPAHHTFFENVYLIKPNTKEVLDMTGLSDDIVAAKMLKSQLNARILLTRGEKGICYFGNKPDNSEDFNIPAHKNNGNFVDVIGAGDNVIATLTHFIEKAIKAANISGGISVTHPGCYPVSEDEILKYIE